MSTLTKAQEMALVLMRKDKEGKENSEDISKFDLNPSRFTIGSSDDDDVFIPELISKNLSLIFADGMVTILNRLSDIWINGNKVESLPLDLKPLEVLSLNDQVHLCYGALDSTWPDIPTLEKLEEEPEIEEVEKPEEIIPEEIKKTEDEQLLDLVPTKEIKVLTDKQRMMKSVRKSLFIFISIFIIAILIIIYNLFSTPNYIEDPIEITNKGASAALNDLIKSDPHSFSAILVTERLDGVLNVSGYVEDDAAYKLLSHEVRSQEKKTGGNVRFDALSKTRLSDLIKDLLVNYPLNYSLKNNNNELILDVVGIKTSYLNKEMLEHEISKIGDRILPKKIVFSIKLEEHEEIEKELKELLNLSALTRGINFSLTDNKIMLKGSISPFAAEETFLILNSIKNELSQRFPIDYDVKVDNRINYKIENIVFSGSEPFITLSQKGKTEVFKQGDSLFEVGTLTEIDRDGIFIAVGKNSIFLPIEK